MTPGESARGDFSPDCLGAMHAEWLATGQGMGYGMLQDANSFNYADIWASAARLSLRDANA